MHQGHNLFTCGSGGGGTVARVFPLLYGVLCYVLFFGAFLYLIGFLGNFAVPKGIDDGTPPNTAIALVTNLGLIALFGFQHSVMARPAFKRVSTRIVPRSIERSTYVLATSVVLAAIYWLWQPMPQVVWQADSPFLRTFVWCVFGTGLLIVLLSTFLIDHFDLFGMRQVYTRFRGTPYEHPPFRVVAFYRLVRHPLYTGFIIALWATPDMTVGHLLFAAGMTTYILLAVPLEERDLSAALGGDYDRYRESVPMLLPRPGKSHEVVRHGKKAPSGMR